MGNDCILQQNARRLVLLSLIKTYLNAYRVQTEKIEFQLNGNLEAISIKHKLVDVFFIKTEIDNILGSL